MKKPPIDELDAYRLKCAETDQERLLILEDAINKAVFRAHMNYVMTSLIVAVLMVAMVHALSVYKINPVPSYAYPWCVLVMAVLIVLPWQLRRFRPLG